LIVEQVTQLNGFVGFYYRSIQPTKSPSLAIVFIFNLKPKSNKLALNDRVEVAVVAL
jgi:hypothetical protein